LHYERRIDRRGTIPKTKNDTFIGNNHILILQGLNSLLNNKIKKVETFSFINVGKIFFLKILNLASLADNKEKFQFHGSISSKLSQIGYLKTNYGDIQGFKPSLQHVCR